MSGKKKLSAMAGHYIAHAGIAVVALSRAWGYSPWYDYSATGPVALTGGHPLWLTLYAGMWALCGVLALADMVAGRTRWGVPMLIGVLTVWGMSYVAAWYKADFSSEDWLTASLYLGVSLTLAGKHIKVAALTERLYKFTEFMVSGDTGALPTTSHKPKHIKAVRDKDQ